MKSKPDIFYAFCLSILFLIGYLDFLAGYQLAFAAFYLIPIIIGTQKVSYRGGVSLAFLGAVIWFVADTQAGRPYSNPLFPYWNACIRFISFFVVVEALHRAKTEKVLATTDLLTGLANRRLFFEACEKELDRAKRYPNVFTILYFDCDDFKEINDTFGHTAGDEYLKTLGEAVLKQLRKTDLLARVGGDEFSILLPETDEAQAKIVIDKIKKAISRISVRGQRVFTVSIGCAIFRDAPENVEDMIKQADHLMYAVKKDGKNGIRFHNFEKRQIENVMAPQVPGSN